MTSTSSPPRSASSPILPSVLRKIKASRLFPCALIPFPVGPHLIVQLPFFGIFQNLIGFPYLFKLCFRFWVIRVLIGMILGRKRTIPFLDLFCIRRSRYAQNLIVIFVFHGDLQRVFIANVVPYYSKPPFWQLHSSSYDSSSPTCTLRVHTVCDIHTCQCYGRASHIQK